MDIQAHIGYILRLQWTQKCCPNSCYFEMGTEKQSKTLKLVRFEPGNSCTTLPGRILHPVHKKLLQITGNYVQTPIEERVQKDFLGSLFIFYNHINLENILQELKAIFIRLMWKFQITRKFEQFLPTFSLTNQTKFNSSFNLF